MRSHSATYKSRPKNRTRPKYHHRSTTNLLDPSSQSDIESTRSSASRSQSQSARALGDNVFFHHHQHHHNYYLPRILSSSNISPSSINNNNNNTNTGCEVKKFLVYAILFFLAYYLLFVAITTTYRHNIYSKNIRNPMMPDRVDLVTANGGSSIRDIYEARKNHIATNPDHIRIHPHQINPIQQIIHDQDQDQGAEIDPLNVADSNDNNQRLINALDPVSAVAVKNVLKNRNAERLAQVAERRKRRRRHRQEVRKLKPFPQMYVSDNPYYLDKNLVIIGQVCEAEKRIDMILYQLESIACLFNSTTFILFESNSEDKTLLHLQRWSLRRPLNCTQIAFKPENKKKYHDIKTLEELIGVFKRKKVDKYESDYVYEYDDIDDMIVNYLMVNYRNIEEVDLYEISMYLTKELRLQKLEEIDIEEILYEKLMAIKYVKYHDAINKHRNKMYKTVLNGDEVVEKDLAIEEEILRQLRVYGSLNELHNGYNVMDELEKERKANELLSDDSDGDDMVDENGELVAIFMDDSVGANELDLEYQFIEGIRREELRRHSHSDFVDEFGDIHEEIEGLIQYDEAIIHEKLRERKRKYEERRRRERQKREEELKRSQNLMERINNKITEELNNKKNDEDNNNKKEEDGDKKEEINNNNNNKKEENVESDKKEGNKLENEAEELLEMMQSEKEENSEKEEMIKFRDKLFRIERFVIYRNMLLNRTQIISSELGIIFDYLLVIDMDIYSIDVRTFMNEAYFMPLNVDGLCIDGIDWMGYTRDTFATVKINGGWLHYGHDTLINNTKYIYDNQHAMYQRTKVPHHKKNRFEEVKSCFGGIMIYRNFENNLFNQQCRYTLTRDVFFTDYNNTEIINDNNDEYEGIDIDIESDEEQKEEEIEFEIFEEEEINSFNKSILNFNYTYSYWLNSRYHNFYSEQSRLEMKLFIKQYVELLQVFDKTIENRELIPKDGDICEHIPFHYCLWDKGFKFAISSRAKLYYDKFYPINRNDTNWPKYISNRPKFTQ